MEEQIKKLQEELELVKKQRDSLIIKRLKHVIPSYQYSDVKEYLQAEKYLQAMIQTFKTNEFEDMIKEYGYDLVVECLIEFFKGYDDDDENEI